MSESELWEKLLSNGAQLPDNILKAMLLELRNMAEETVAASRLNRIGLYGVGLLAVAEDLGLGRVVDALIGVLT